MKLRLNDCWWSELGFEELYLLDISFDKFESLHKLCEYLSNGLNHIMDRLYYFCDMVEFTWYYDYWKTKQFEEMTYTDYTETDVAMKLNLNETREFFSFIGLIYFLEKTLMITKSSLNNIKLEILKQNRLIIDEEELVRRFQENQGQ